MKIGERLSINKVRKGYIISKGLRIYTVVKANVWRDEKWSSVVVYPVIEQVDLELLSELLNTELDNDILDACQVLDYDDFINDMYTYIDHLVIKRRR